MKTLSEDCWHSLFALHFQRFPFWERSTTFTNICFKPPFTEIFNAPIIYRSTRLAAFKGISPRKWLKTGIELINGKPHLSTVFKNRSTDRSLFPVPSQGRAATLEIAREPGTSSLWVYHVEGDSPLREITWALEGEDKAQECWVGIYAARPSSQGGNLDVNLKHLVID
ncbi:uncharacterized protein ASPGLDRAFT_72219 [Aspergillus glaucus CBS 516.65]|uniref:Uncharacterized protein n=1 Tax=Aspergillus glaucus CBS 516.65 TaxID=1160497 RepID=A0A1L9VW52_ASPGL|nr:hypothetical protein ASPGLDRAFT_72219 [Aspergillus glaucus CBS 516.65]OJJ88126.1 hypothetical protein ASPGLDRAFT_72219 [Aspergillus glaucus CBS 516.65]